VKGTYYFDQLLHAGPRWDFYGAGSLGFALVNTTWNADYYGSRNYYIAANPLFLDLHIGTEYHVSNRVGLFLDLSTGVSTIGIALHH
jgi:Zn-dependent M28 family amino/carboxypeptidase